jgi:hypothetical protein
MKVVPHWNKHFTSWEKVDLGFCVVDVGKLFVIMTAQKDSNTTRKCGFLI